MCSWDGVWKVFDPHQKVKVIAQQAVGERPRDRLDVFQVEPQEVAVIAFFDKEILAVIAAIVDMIILPILQWRGIHGVPRRARDLSGGPSGSLIVPASVAHLTGPRFQRKFRRGGGGCQLEQE